MRTATWIVALFLAAPLAAQAWTSPAGFGSVEGNEVFERLFGATDLRFQQIDATLVGSAPRTLRSIAFRRDGAIASRDGRDRDVTLTVVLANGNATPSGTFGANYAGLPSWTVSSRRIHCPDWSSLTAAPAQFDFVVPFDAPWAYDGTQPLLWEVVATASSRSEGLAVDRHVGASPFGYAEGTALGTGCIARAWTAPFSHVTALFNYGSANPSFGMRLAVRTENAPPNESVVMNVAFVPNPFTLPGLCGDIQFLPLTTSAIGQAGVEGHTPLLYKDFPYAPGLEGITVVTQALALDPSRSGLPIVLSEGRRTTMPAVPPTLDCLYLWGDPVTGIGNVFLGRGLVAAFATD
jgi:hypothetical protein